MVIAALISNWLAPLVSTPFGEIYSRMALKGAVKYSPPGEIAIDIHSDAGQTELRIRDHGPGLPAGQAELIFERYRRGEHTSPVPGGTGLGLYVARQIVQAHDGKLWLAEHGPDGCTFILTLPTVA